MSCKLGKRGTCSKKALAEREIHGPFEIGSLLCSPKATGAGAREMKKETLGSLGITILLDVMFNYFRILMFKIKILKGASSILIV